jgi:hypothetical protein
MTFPTPHRVAAGLIYLSVGSLVGLLLAPLLAATRWGVGNVMGLRTMVRQPAQSFSLSRPRR